MSHRLPSERRTTMTMGSTCRSAPCILAAAVHVHVGLMLQVLGLILVLVAAAASADSMGTDYHAKSQVDWLLSNGGFFSPKLEFRRMVPTDPSSPYGLFTSEDIAKGEVVFTVPRKCLLTSKTQDFCDTVRDLVEQYKLGEESDYWPFARYAMDDRHRGDLPSEWSDAGKDLLESIVPRELMNPDEGDFQGRVTELSYKEDCGVPDATPLDEFAYLSVLRRSWDVVMVPIYDMINHRNGRWKNVDSNSVHEGKDVSVYAIRNISAGEQLHNSYNECTDCRSYSNTHVGHLILRDYGFVEQYPRRWNFDNSWIIFEVDEIDADVSASDADSGREGKSDREEKELKLTWLSEEYLQTSPDVPGFEEKVFLHGHLRRLNSMRDDVVARAAQLASDHERSMIVAFYEALVEALDTAVFTISESQEKEREEEEDNDNNEANQVCSSNLPDPQGTCFMSRSYDEFVEGPYFVDNVEYVCEPFPDDSRRYDHSRYEPVASYFSHHQGIHYTYSDKDDDTCLFLDGDIQACSSNRPHYHEGQVHFAAGHVDTVERVLILGGGDSMILHEVMKYPSLKFVLALELDQMVVRSSYKHFGVHPHFDDERVHWWFGDAAKSLLLIPKEYHGTFDLVLIDVQNRFVEALNIMDDASVLVRPEGVISRTEDFAYYGVGFSTNEGFAKYSVDLFIDDMPAWCTQLFTIGSNGVDLLKHPWKSHGDISTLYFHPSDPSNFRLYYNYRKSDDACKERVVVEDNKMSTEQTSSQGILFILEAENLVLPLNSAAAVRARLSEALKEAGVTEISASVDNDEDESEAYVIVFVLQEGYAVARIWPEHKYGALDLQLWTRFDRQDIIKAKLSKALGSAAGKFSSSYGIITTGMFGIATWKEDREKGIGSRLRPSNLCVNEHESELVRSADAERKDSNSALTASASLIQDKDAAIAVICGNEEKPCSSLETLRKESDKVMPVFTCPTMMRQVADVGSADDPSERLFVCETETLATLKSIVATHGKLGGIVLDHEVPLAIGQVLHKLLINARVRRDLMRESFVVLETSLNPNVSSWRSIFLDRFRTDFVEFSPAFNAKVLFNSTISSLELGVFSTDEDFFSKLANVIARIERETGLTSDVRYVKNGLNNYLPEFKPSEPFTDSDFASDSSEPDGLKTSQLMGGQRIFQFQVGGGHGLSAFQVKLSLQHAFQMVHSDGMDEVDIQLYDNVGEGCIVVALWSKGNVVVQWDGRDAIDLNIFTQVGSIDIHRAFVDALMEKIPSVKVVLRDDQPRGMGAWKFSPLHIPYSVDSIHDLEQDAPGEDDDDEDVEDEADDEEEDE